MREQHPRELLTLRQAADRLGVHPRTVRRRIADGNLPGYRVGSRTLRVDAADVDALLTPVANYNAW